MKKLLLVISAAMILTGCGTPSTSSQVSTVSSGVESTSSGAAETPTEMFLSARKNTYESTTYEYNYLLEAKIKYKDALSYSPANISGKVQWNKNGNDTNYLEKRTLSGILLFDSTSYTYNSGDSLITVNEDEDKDFSVADFKGIDNAYDFETNSVGCLLKKLDNSGNLEVEKSGDKYNLHLHTNFGQESLLSVLNYIDSEKILNALNKLTVEKWGTALELECYAKLDETTQKVKDFVFNANVNVKDTVSIVFTFEQHFTSFNGDITMDLPSFNNTFISTTEIDSQLSGLKSKFTSNKEAYYNYEVKTAVDHGVSKENPLGLAVNSTSKGYAQRAKIGEEIFFRNELELDSDYKNADQYPDIAEDYKLTRVKLNNTNKEVYDCENKIFPLKDVFTLIEDYDNDTIDDYYMLIKDEWLSSNMVKILRKSVTEESTTEYKLGLSSDGVKEILYYFNDAIRLSPDTSKEHIDVYQVYSNFKAKKADFIIETDTEGDITDISIELKGFYNMDESDDVKFKFEYEVEFDYTKSVYSIPTTTSDIF